MHVPVRAIMAILQGAQPKGLQCNFSNAPCHLCTLRCREDPAHVLFECPALQEARDSTLPGLLRAMPSAMAECFSAMSNADKVRQIVSCYGGKYTQEWNSVYFLTAIMVSKLYEKRHSMYTD